MSRHREQKLRAIAYMGGACQDCGGTFTGHPEIFNFDHLYGKNGATSRLGYLFHRVGWARIVEELKKCELVCSNCHYIRTEERREFGCTLN